MRRKPLGSGERPPPAERPGAAKAVATYLYALRPVVTRTVDARRMFIHHLGALIETARHGNPARVAQDAGRIGREHAVVFRDARHRLTALAPPGPCAGCHETASGWIEMHVAACEVLAEIGTNGDLTRVREAQGLLTEGRRFAQRFNAAYSGLVIQLREQVATAQRTAAARRR